MSPCPIRVELRFATWILAVKDLIPTPPYLPGSTVASLYVIFIKFDLPNFPMRAKCNNVGFTELCNMSFLEGNK